MNILIVHEVDWLKKITYEIHHLSELFSLEGHKVYEEGQDKWAVIRAIMQNYHKTDKEVIFDKNRGWSTHIEFIEKATN